MVSNETAGRLSGGPKPNLSGVESPAAAASPERLVCLVKAQRESSARRRFVCFRELLMKS